MSLGLLPSIVNSIKKVKNPLVRLLLSDLNLGKGESEVIALASETGIKTIIDDIKARKVAETLGLSVTGTIGILLKAEKSGLIESAYNKAKELKDKGFHVSDELLDDISICNEGVCPEYDRYVLWELFLLSSACLECILSCHLCQLKRTVRMP